MAIDYQFWHETTLSVAAAGGVVGFFRSLEQRKDDAFAAVMTRLCDKSPVLAGGAARQLPSFHRYRRFIIGRRPYRDQALALAIDGLKVDQTRFVRQALMESLQKMLAVASEIKPTVRLDHSTLDELTMMGFDFEYVELTKSSIRKSGLEGARFAGANLWCTVFQGSNLKDADFTDAKLWDADFSNTNLDGAKLLTPNVNPQTTFASSTLRGATISSAVRDLCRNQGCDLSQARIQ